METHLQRKITERKIFIIVSIYIFMFVYIFGIINQKANTLSCSVKTADAL